MGDCMNKKILAKIKLNGVEYVCYLDENNKIIYSKLNKFGDGTEVLEQSENETLNKVLTKVMISRDKTNYIKLKQINFNNKLFQVLYDKISGFEFFYEIKNEQYFIPDKEDFISLFSIFNYEYLFSAEKHMEVDEIEEPKTWFRRTIFNGIAAITISIGLLGMYNLFYSTIPVYQLSPKDNISQVERIYDGESKSKETVSIDKLLIALRDNKNLTQEEKELYLGYIEYIDVNKEYFDAEYLYSTFENVFSVYNPEIKPGDSTGTWNGINISIYGSSSLEKEDCEVFVHELGHSIGLYGCDGMSYGISIEEGYTQILNKEYDYKGMKNNYYVGYTEQVNYQKMMFEILGAEPFTQFHGDGNIFHVIDALKDIIPNEQMAIDLVYSLDLTISEIKLKSQSLSEDPLISSAAQKKLFDLRNEIKTCRENIYSSLSQYFLQAKGYPMEDDFIMMSYYYDANPNLANDKSVEIDADLINASDGWPLHETYSILYSDLDLKKGYLMPAYIRQNKDVNLNVNIGIPYAKSVCSTNENGEVISQYITDYNYTSVVFTIDDTNRRINNGTINYGPVLIPTDYNNDIQPEIGKQKG